MIMLVERGAHVVAIAPQRSECIFLPSSGKGEGIRFYAWEAIAWCLEADEPQSLPRWCLEYIKVTAANLHSLACGVDFRDPAKKITSDQAFMQKCKEKVQDYQHMFVLICPALWRLKI
jgi:hypothetical protein